MTTPGILYLALARASLAGLKGERELCRHCDGNGVVAVLNAAGVRIGVTVCPRCAGYCWEPRNVTLKKGEPCRRG